MGLFQCLHCVFIEKLRSSSNGAEGLNFKGWSFDEFSMVQRLPSTHWVRPWAQQGGAERGHAGSKFTVRRRRRKMWRKPWLSCMLSAVGLHGARGSLLRGYLPLQTGTGEAREKWISLGFEGWVRVEQTDKDAEELPSQGAVCAWGCEQFSVTQVLGEGAEAEGPGEMVIMVEGVTFSFLLASYPLIHHSNVSLSFTSEKQSLSSSPGS